MKKKKSILDITNKKINQTFSVPRNVLDVHFGIICKSIHRRSACLPVHLPLWRKKHNLEHVCDLFEIKRTCITFFILLYMYLICRTT